MAGIAMPRDRQARGSRLIGVAAVGLGILTAVLVVAYLRQQADDQRVRSSATTSVVVAKNDIPIGVIITPDMVEVTHVTPDLAVPAAFEETTRVVGLRSRSPIPARAQIVPGMTVQSGAADALSFVVPPGKRAVAITGSDVVGSGGHIRPGDFVDVLVTVEAWRLNGSNATISNEKPRGVYTILQNVEVLAVSSEAEKITASGPDAKNKDDEDKTKSLSKADNKSVTLAVTPSQAQLLFLAESEGKIRLALRPFGERDETPVAPVVEPILLGGKS